MKKYLLPILLAFLVLAPGCTPSKDSVESSQSAVPSSASENSVAKPSSSTVPSGGASKDSSTSSQAPSSSNNAESSALSQPSSSNPTPSSAPSSSTPSQAPSSGSSQSSQEIIVGPSIEVGVPTEVIEIVV